MFYTKHKLSEDSTVITTLRGDNVFTRCPCCGVEITVDLARVFADGNGSMDLSSVLCDECSAELLRTGGSQ